MGLAGDDRQLQYALNAVKRYRESESPDFIGNGGNHGSTNNNKRHIVNVDDTSKINYEMIKNSPGNLPAQGSIDSVTDAEINGLKTKMFKGRLYELNDDFLDAINMNLEKVNGKEGDNSMEKSIPLEDQCQWLEQIQEDLVQRYRALLNEEKKWFVLKELLLEANTELDLYSAQDSTRSTIKLGSAAIPTNSNSNVLVFNRTKRQKVRQTGIQSNLSPIV